MKKLYIQNFYFQKCYYLLNTVKLVVLFLGGEPDAQHGLLMETRLGHMVWVYVSEWFRNQSIEPIMDIISPFILESFDKQGYDNHSTLFTVFFFFHISPQMCVYLFLMFLLPYHTFQFGTFDTNMLEHFAAAPKLESEKESGERERKRETQWFSNCGCLCSGCHFG